MSPQGLGTLPRPGVQVLKVPFEQCNLLVEVAPGTFFFTFESASGNAIGSLALTHYGG
jgi:hypothetical protein